MSTYDLPAEAELIVQSRKAAYCARRRLNGADVSPQDLEDMMQTAALAYWKRREEGRSIPFCFVCARQAAQKYFYRKSRRHSAGIRPLHPISWDVPLHDGGDLPHGRSSIPPPSPFPLN
jgi:hypothetical protein